MRRPEAIGDLDPAGVRNARSFRLLSGLFVAVAAAAGYAAGPKALQPPLCYWFMAVGLMVAAGAVSTALQRKQHRTKLDVPLKEFEDIPRLAATPFITQPVASIRRWRSDGSDVVYEIDLRRRIRYRVWTATFLFAIGVAFTGFAVPGGLWQGSLFAVWTAIVLTVMLHAAWQSMEGDVASASDRRITIRPHDVSIGPRTFARGDVRCVQVTPVPLLHKAADNVSEHQTTFAFELLVVIDQPGGLTRSAFDVVHTFPAALTHHALPACRELGIPLFTCNSDADRHAAWLHGRRVAEGEHEATEIAHSGFRT